MQTNCLECNCYDFEGTGDRVSLCRATDCNESSEKCVCGHTQSDHYDEDRYHMIPYPECVNNDCPSHPYVL